MISLTAILVAMVGGSSPACAGFIGVAFTAVLGSARQPGVLAVVPSWIKFIRTAGMISAHLDVYGKPTNAPSPALI